MATSELPRDDLIKYLREIQRRISILEQRDSFANTGLTVPAVGEVDVQGMLRVLGDLVVSGQATVDATGGIQSSNYQHLAAGWRFDGASLEVNTGVIGNSALTNPVAVTAPYDYVQNFPLTTTLTNIRTKLVPIPAGFTKAAVAMTARVFAINPTSTGGYDTKGGDYLYAQANINGFNGFALPLAVSGSNGSGTNLSPFAAILTGLTPGANLSLQIAASTGFSGWAANASNVAEITASVQWFR